MFDSQQVDAVEALAKAELAAGNCVVIGLQTTGQVGVLLSPQLLCLLIPMCNGLKAVQIECVCACAV